MRIKEKKSLCSFVSLTFHGHPKESHPAKTVSLYLWIWWSTILLSKKEIYVFPLGAETVKHQEQSAILYVNRQGVLCIYTEYIVMSTQRDIKLAQYGEMCDVVSQGFKTVHYALSFRRQSSKWSSETPLQSI